MREQQDTWLGTVLPVQLPGPALSYALLEGQQHQPSLATWEPDQSCPRSCEHKWLHKNFNC